MRHNYNIYRGGNHMNKIKCDTNKMITIPLKMQITLEREEADLVWRLLLNARGKQIDDFGHTEFTEKLLNMMHKFCFPDSSTTTKK